MIPSIGGSDDDIEQVSSQDKGAYVGRTHDRKVQTLLLSLWSLFPSSISVLI